MPSIGELLVHGGWVQFGADFYFPAAHPHVHLQVNNAATVVPNLVAIRPTITFISLSYGGAPAAVPLYQRNPPDQDLATNSYDLDMKNAFEVALHDTIGIEVAMGMQQRLNTLTGMGIDL